VKGDNMEAKDISRAVIKEALLDLLDGMTDWKEIQRFTGMSETRCKEIYNIGLELQREK
jgi:hypothetical protein